MVAPTGGGKSLPDWGRAFTSACLAQAEAERLSDRSSDGERLLFADLVALHYAPTQSDAAPHTRKNTASHLGDNSGVPTRKRALRRACGRSLLLYAFGHLPIGAIGPNEVHEWISQMVVDGDTYATIRAKTSLLKTILQVAVPQGWLTDNVVDPARLPKAVEQPDKDRVITPEVRRLLNKPIWTPDCVGLRAVPPMHGGLPVCARSVRVAPSCSGAHCQARAGGSRASSVRCWSATFGSTYGR